MKIVLMITAIKNSKPCNYDAGIEASSASATSLIIFDFE